MAPFPPEPDHILRTLLQAIFALLWSGEVVGGVNPSVFRGAGGGSRGVGCWPRCGRWSWRRGQGFPKEEDAVELGALDLSVTNLTT